MATADRVGRLGLVGVDAFGRAAAAYARTRMNVDFLEGVPAGREFRLLALVAGRPVPGLARQLDQVAFDNRIPFVTIWWVDGRLQIGPVVVPGRSACYLCWEKRQRQHTRSRDAHDALLAHQAATEPPENLGLLPTVARLAGAQVLRLDAELAASEEHAGRIWITTIPPTTVTEGRVAAVHGCERCASQRPR